MIGLDKMSIIAANNDVAVVSMQLVFVANEQHINAQTFCFAMTREGLRKLGQDLLTQVSVMENLPIVETPVIQTEVST